MFEKRLLVKDKDYTMLNNHCFQSLQLFWFLSSESYIVDFFTSYINTLKIKWNVLNDKKR